MAIKEQAKDAEPGRLRVPEQELAVQRGLFGSERGSFSNRETGDHGPIFREFHHDAQGAIAKLREVKSGDAIGALHHPAVGDIDLIWGRAGDPANDFKGGYGLAHLDAKHPGIAEQLDRIIPSLEKGELQGRNRQVLVGKDHRAVVGLDWSDKAKRWLLTAYREASPSSEGFSSGSKRASAEGPTTPSQGDDSSMAGKRGAVKRNEGERGSFSFALKSSKPAAAARYPRHS